MKTIREARLAAELTQEQMSEIMCIPKRTIENWEGGKRNPPAYVERLVIAELERMKDKSK